MNLTDGNRIYTLQHSDLPATPLSINISITREKFEYLIPHIGQEINFNRKGLFAFGSIIDKSGAEIIDCELKIERFPTTVEISMLYDQLTKYLFEHKGKGEMVKAALNVITESKSNLSPFGKHIETVMREIMNSSSPREIAYQSLRLIGVGEGLTPAGDDFNCGLLAVMIYLKGLGLSDEIQHQIQTELPSVWDTTTDISREYLIYANEGKFNEWIIRLFNYSQKGIDIVPTINEIKTIGHSSGSDFLTGLYFGLRVGGKIT